MSWQFETKNDEEICQILIKEKLTFIENAQERLLGLRTFSASLVTSVVKGIICDVERMEMTGMSAKEISRFEVEIAGAVQWIQAMGTHLDEHVQQIATITEHVDCEGFDRTDIVQMIGEIIVFSKVDINVGFVFDI